MTSTTKRIKSLRLFLSIANLLRYTVIRAENLDGGDEFISLLFGLNTVLYRLAYVVFGMVLDNKHRGLLRRGSDAGDLGENFRARSVPLHHSRYSPHLALDAPQALAQFLSLFSVDASLTYTGFCLPTFRTLAFIR